MANDRDDAPHPDEDLVAYLDGELEAADAGAVEEKLASDATTRSKAETLRKTYDLLDYLPKPEPSANFATRTLTQIAPNSKSQTFLPARRSTLAFIGWAAAAILAGLLGYFGHLLAKPHLDAKPVPQPLQQVRLLERLPLYAGVDDLDYLKSLDSLDLFGDAEAKRSRCRSR